MPEFLRNFGSVNSPRRQAEVIRTAHAEALCWNLSATLVPGILPVSVPADQVNALKQNLVNALQQDSVNALKQSSFNALQQNSVNH